MIDHPHLARQTMGDNRLADELLGMFVLQLDAAAREIANADEPRRAALAHSLKGTARSLGIFAVADCACALEGPTADPQAFARLAELAAALRREVDDRLRPAG